MSSRHPQEAQSWRKAHVAEALAFAIRLLVAVLLATIASVALPGCSPQSQQLATCIAGKAAARCLPACALCVKDVVSECRSSASSTGETCAGQPR